MARETDDVPMNCRLLATLAFTVSVLATLPAYAKDELCLDDAPVCIEAVQDGMSLRFLVNNQTNAPYSIRVVFDELEGEHQFEQGAASQGGGRDLCEGALQRCSDAAARRAGDRARPGRWGRRLLGTRYTRWIP